MGKRYGRLGIEERTMIQRQLEMGSKPAVIALGLNRSASTLSRELRRDWHNPFDLFIDLLAAERLNECRRTAW